MKYPLKMTRTSALNGRLKFITGVKTNCFAQYFLNQNSIPRSFKEMVLYSLQPDYNWKKIFTTQQHCYAYMYDWLIAV